VLNCSKSVNIFLVMAKTPMLYN